MTNKLMNALTQAHTQTYAPVTLQVIHPAVRGLTWRWNCPKGRRIRSKIGVSITLQVLGETPLSFN